MELLLNVHVTFNLVTSLSPLEYKTRLLHRVNNTRKPSELGCQPARNREISYSVARCALSTYRSNLSDRKRFCQIRIVKRSDK